MPTRIRSCSALAVCILVIIGALALLAMPVSAQVPYHEQSELRIPNYGEDNFLTILAREYEEGDLWDPPL